MLERLARRSGLSATLVVLSVLGVSRPTLATVPAPPVNVLMESIEPSSSFLTSPPAVAVLNDAFTDVEAGACAVGDAVSCQLSALDDTFTGAMAGSTDSSQRDQFRSQIATYLNANAVQYSDPGCTSSAGTASGFRLFSHTKAYQIRQADFLNLYQQYMGGLDFLPPAARKMNSYMGNQKCPLVSIPTETSMQQSFGSLAYFGSNNVTLLTDNRFNPWRWTAPLNQVHHHEQPSLSFMMTSTAAAAAATHNILTAALSGNESQRILMNYDIDLITDDYRSLMGEFSLSDFLDSSRLGTDLFSLTRNNIRKFVAQLQPGDLFGPTILKYFRTRFNDASIQLSLAVVWQNNGVRWHDTEFMIAGKNYLRSYTAAFAPVTNPDWLSYMPEGGNSGTVAWTRLRLDGLVQARVNEVDPTLVPIRQGGSYYDIPDGHSVQHLTGTIDLTDYYKFAMKSKTFPGTSGTDDGQPVSSLDPNTGQLVAAETHAVNTAGIIYEVHGPYAIKVQVNRFDIQIVGGLSIPQTPTAPTVELSDGTEMAGNIDGEQRIGGGTFLVGWACIVGRSDPMRLMAFAGNGYPNGQFIGSYLANAPAESAVALACQDPLASPHRFQIPLGLASQDLQPGEPIYLYGLSLDGTSKTLVSGSGSVDFS